MFRGLREKTGSSNQKQARDAYCMALEYLRLRVFGESVLEHGHALPTFRKKRYDRLPDSCKKQLHHANVPAMFFGLHVAQDAAAEPLQALMDDPDMENPCVAGLVEQSLGVSPSPKVVERSRSRCSERRS